MSQHAAFQWSNLSNIPLPKEDSLMACLMLLTYYFHNPVNSQALLSRIKKIDKNLDIDTFQLVAKKVGIDASIETSALKNISNPQLPAVLILKNEQAVLMILDEEGERKILDPIIFHFSSLDDYKKEYSGQVIYVDTQSVLDRGDELTKEEKKSWFWPVIFKSWPTYGEILVASFLINLFVLAVPLFTKNIYDRVIPNQAIETMWVLATGIGLVFIFDFLLRTLRSYFLDEVSVHSEVELSQDIFAQLLGSVDN